MRTPADRAARVHRNGCEAEIRARVATLFDRYPALCGFTLRGNASLAREGVMPALESDLYLTEVSIGGAHDAPMALCADIASAFSTLIDEWPEALALLHERTFARTLH